MRLPVIHQDVVSLVPGLGFGVVVGLPEVVAVDALVQRFVVDEQGAATR